MSDRPTLIEALWFGRSVHGVMMSVADQTAIAIDLSQRDLVSAAAINRTAAHYGVKVPRYFGATVRDEFYRLIRRSLR